MSKAKILVVDDSPTHLKLASTPLIEEGYNVITATDGEEALRQVENEMPVLIVLDVIMPKMNGFQVCRKIKSSADFKDIKIILCTSKTQESDKFWGKKQGADAYLTKPFTDKDLIAAVAELL